jgi:hypothetical protein
MEAVRAVFLLAFFVATAPAQHHHHHKPALQGTTSLDLYAEAGALHLLTGEQEGESITLHYRRSSDGGATWSTSVRLPGPGPRPVRRGDDAQIAARGDRILAVWSVSGTGWGGSGPLASALSEDGGRTWTAAASPSDSASTRGHGFVDLLAGAGGFHAVWLDGRDKAQGLRYARSADGRSWSANETIAPKTCECCWNSLLEVQGALHVLYRAGHPRDMSLAVREKDVWRHKGAVAKFDWYVKGCPETGGALAATPDGTVHALSWTGKAEALGLYVSSQRVERWSPPRRLGSAAAQHGDLAANGSTLFAAWDEDGAIHASRSRDAGANWEAPRRLSEGREAANPRVAPAGDGFLILWTESGADGRRVLRMERL